MSLSPIGDRQSVGGDIILTFFIAFSIALPCSRFSLFGFMSWGISAFSQISLATL